jgi:hypothetical protein
MMRPGCETGAREGADTDGLWHAARYLLALGLVVALLGTVSASADAAGIRYSRLPLATELSTPCPPAESGGAECGVIVPPTEGPEAEEANGSGEGGGLDPQDLRSAYSLPEHGGSGRTVAVVTAFNDPSAAADLAVYRSRYGLPECTEASGCFRKVNEHGETGEYPPNGGGWTTEASLDLDMVSAGCPECQILLVEATNTERVSMFTAEETAVALGATAVSNSWSFGFEREIGAEETSFDHYFDHPGVPIVVSGGDYGYGTRYPASSQYTIAVGGTRLSRAPLTARGWTESVWSNPSKGERQKGRGSGSGCSEYEPKPSWQSDIACPGRMETDISAVADPSTPLSVYDTNLSEGGSGWLLLGGTSAAAPFVAGVEGMSSSYSIGLGAEAFYMQPGSLNDITEGNNGTCTPPAEDAYWCAAGIGYDGPSGIGTPDGPFNVTPKPLATIRPASEVTKSSAVLQGLVNPHGHATTYRFEYGETTSYGHSTPEIEASAGEGTSAVSVSQPVRSLTFGAAYHYRLVATSGEGTSYSADALFTPGGWGLGSPASPGAVTAAELEGVSCPAATECFAVGEYQNAVGAALASTQRWDGSRWSVTRTPQPAEAIRSKLQSVACAATTTCVAVGTYETSTTTEAFAEEWNGSGWEESAVPQLKEAQSSRLDSVSCPSTVGCVAVGEYVNGEGKHIGFSATWNGVKWKAVAPVTPSEAKEAQLQAVTCTVSTTCTAVGWYATTAGHQLPLGETWNGKAWTAISMATPPGAERTVLEGVSCTGPLSCIASGWSTPTSGNREAIAELWNGTSWQMQAVAIPEGAVKTMLAGVQCLSAIDCTAAGSYTTSEGAEDTLVEHLAGAHWELQSTPNPTGSTSDALHAIGCPVSGSSCTAVGTAHSTEGTPSTLIESSTSAVWSIASPADFAHEQRTALAGIACQSSIWCMTTGDFQNNEGFDGAAAQAWNGTSWQTVRTAQPSETQRSALVATSCVSTVSCWAAGGELTNTGATEALIEHWNGTAWEVQSVPAPKGAQAAALRALSCTSSSMCIAVGEYLNSESKRTALSVTWNGLKWKTLATSPPAGATASVLSGISCPSATSCEAVGTYTNTTGHQVLLVQVWAKKWSNVPMAPPSGAENSSLEAVACPSTTSCLAVGWSQSSGGGDTPLGERWNGSAWLEQSPGNPSSATSTVLQGVACANTTNCTAVGSYATATIASSTLAEHWNGTGWERQGTPNPAGVIDSELRAIACPAIGVCDAVGSSQSSEGVTAALIEETP